jgi:hypothetical protein
MSDSNKIRGVMVPSSIVDVGDMAMKDVACRYMAIDRLKLSSSPPCGRAVRGSMKLCKEIRAAEVNGRYPRVFVVTIAFPMD